MLCSLLSLLCGVVQQLGIDSFSGEGGSVEEHNTYQAMMQVCTASSCPFLPCAVDMATVCAGLQRHSHAQQFTLTSICTEVLQASVVDEKASEYTIWQCLSCHSSTVVTAHSTASHQ